jgi:hypothetical protein
MHIPSHSQISRRLDLLIPAVVLSLSLIPPLPFPPHLIALGHNLLAQPLGRKAPIQRIQVPNNILAAPHNRILGRNGPVGGDAKLERGEERVRDLVGGKGDLGVLEEALREQVGERVVFFVEGEGRGVWDACDATLLAYIA